MIASEAQSPGSGAAARGTPGTPRVLIVDDERTMREFLSVLVKRQGFEPIATDSLVGMNRILAETGVDLVLLDVNLPDGSGLEALKELRGASRTPVIMLTAANEPIDRILGLELGADDYVAKPFEPRELVARMKTVLRRAGPGLESPVGGPGDALLFAGMTLDLAQRTLVDAAGNPIELTSAELDLLRCLAEAAGRPLSRDRILDVTRDRNWSPLDRSIDVLIGRLRRKLEPDPDSPSLIKTVRGVGYIFSVPVRRRRQPRD